LENTVYGLEIQGVPRAKQLEEAHRWIERVGLKGFEAKYPNQLSGGMQQRVGLARALTNDAPILLMDEAFSALDPLIRVDMQTVLLDLQKEIKKTIVFITHDLDEALRLGDRIAILRDGEIIQQGTGQDIVLSPADAYIESFVQEVNRGRVIRVDTIMSAPQGDSTNLPVIRFDCLLEEAMRKLVEEQAEQINICCEKGTIIGQTSVSSVMAAMVRR
jgi:glycine betaine/proline transport system ATP-binding protein